MSFPSDHGLQLRQWRWPLPRWYNGFSPQERVRGWQAAWWLIDNGHIPHPDTCSITGKKGREPGECLRASTNPAGRRGGGTAFAYHNENYYDPFELYPISPEAHRLLHRRFYDPKPWQALVEEHSRTGEEWFARLNPYPIDMASELRERLGPGITDILKTATARVAGAASSCDNV
jgi:hypothetical protein